VNDVFLAVEHRGERALRIVDLNRDFLRINPVEFEEAANQLVEFRPLQNRPAAAATAGTAPATPEPPRPPPNPPPKPPAPPAELDSPTY